MKRLIGFMNFLSMLFSMIFAFGYMLAAIPRTMTGLEIGYGFLPYLVSTVFKVINYYNPFNNLSLYNLLMALYLFSIIYILTEKQLRPCEIKLRKEEERA